jgi:hypothetical protein
MAESGCRDGSKKGAGSCRVLVGDNLACTGLVRFWWEDMGDGDVSPSSCCPLAVAAASCKRRKYLDGKLSSSVYVWLLQR